MTTTVFLVVLLAAFLHASWNGLVKGGNDKFLAMTAVVLGQGLFAIPVLFFVPPPDQESYLPMALGVVLHVGYQILLLNSYKAGDFGQIYPVARGSAPIFLVLFSAIFLGENIGRLQLFSVLLIGVGIMSMTLLQRTECRLNHNAAFLALMTGVFIAGYSIVDGVGARLAGTALGFYSWLSIANALAFSVFVALWRPRILIQIPSNGLTTMLIGGSASFSAYALVIWSFTQAPIALVASLREVSIFFALLIGVLFFKEKLNTVKILATIVTFTGVVLLRVYR